MNHLRNAIKKCRRFMGGPEYCGYLIPSEILALVDAGAKSVHSDKDGKERWEYKIAGYRLQKSQGYSSGDWFYFLPPKGIHMQDREFKYD